MSNEGAPRVRPARRSDLDRLVELRHWYLAETARLEPRFRLVPEARERVHAAVASWLGNEERDVLVAERDGTVEGYATGVLSVWPPIFKAQRVGEVAECFVVPAARGGGLGRALLVGLAEALSRRGADILRAPVPSKNDGSIALFHAVGFAPHLVVMERGPASR